MHIAQVACCVIMDVLGSTIFIHISSQFREITHRKFESSQGLFSNRGNAHVTLGLVYNTISYKLGRLRLRFSPLQCSVSSGDLELRKGHLVCSTLWYLHRGVQTLLWNREMVNSPNDLVHAQFLVVQAMIPLNVPVRDPPWCTSDPAQFSLATR